MLDYTGIDGGRLAAAFAAGCIATWAFIHSFLIRPINKSYEKRIVDLEKDNERCEHRVGFLEMLLYQHGTSEIREMMQTMFSARDVEARDPVGAAKAAPEAIWLPANVKGGEK